MPRLALPEQEISLPSREEEAAERKTEGNKRVLAAIVHDPNARVGAAIVLLFIALAVLAPVIAPDDPLRITGDRLHGPSLAHPLGTDGLGRDVFSRVLFGARLSLGVAGATAILVMTFGVFLGAVAGFYGGAVEAVIMRVVDLILALPGLVLAFAIAGLFQPGLLAVFVGLVSVGWVGYARIVRGLVLSVRGRDYVAAARGLGASNRRLLLRHVLPNVFPSVLVLLTLRTGRLILAVGGLSFLGLGPQPPAPEWGAMLNAGRPYFPAYPHLLLAPGMAITLVVIGLNLLGDGLRDLVDPRTRQATASL